MRSQKAPPTQFDASTCIEAFLSSSDLALFFLFLLLLLLLVSLASRFAAFPFPLTRTAFASLPLSVRFATLLPFPPIHSSLLALPFISVHLFSTNKFAR